MRMMTALVAMFGLAAAATAQSGGSTYPQGSNLPQRSAGEIAAKPDGAGGAAAQGSKGAVQSKAASHNGAKPRHRPRTPH